MNVENYEQSKKEKQNEKASLRGRDWTCKPINLFGVLTCCFSLNWCTAHSKQGHMSNATYHIG